MIASAGATHLGFPFRLNFHSEDTSEAEAAYIITQLPKDVEPVLITYLDSAKEIAALMKSFGCDIVQVHGDISRKEIQDLRRIKPQIEIWKSMVINPENPESINEFLKKFEPWVDAFITDTFDPKTGASGATGKTHDWNVSRKMIKVSKKPVIVAGGLHPENVSDCIKFTRPAGVDVHTGVEGRNGLKNPDLVKTFVQNARRAFAEIDQPV